MIGTVVISIYMIYSMLKPQFKPSRNILFSGIWILAVIQVLLLTPNNNYYNALSVSKVADKKGLKAAFVKYSLVNHPDKSNAPNAAEKFNTMKDIYDILQDEKQREIYDRFGDDETNFKFDPRDDPLKLSASLGVKYLYWALLLYFFTLPTIARGCRALIFTLWLTIMMIELSITFSNIRLAMVLPSALFNWTEYQFIQYLYSFLPYIVISLRINSEYSYIDVSQTTDLMLEELYHLEKETQIALNEIQSNLSINEGNNSAPNSPSRNGSSSTGNSNGGSGSGNNTPNRTLIRTPTGSITSTSYTHSSESLQQIHDNVSNVITKVNSFTNKGKEITNLLESNSIVTENRPYWLIFIVMAMMIYAKPIIAELLVERDLGSDILEEMGLSSEEL